MAAKENTKQQGYTAESIQVLEGLEPVRKRPGMYIGSTGPDGLHHLIHEVADNGIDEAMIGYAKNIEISLLPNNRVRVKDDGRGIPVERHKQTGKSTLETVMTILHAGGKFGSGAYKVSGGLHGVGVSVVNALSVYLRVEVRRDGGVYEQEYVRGKPKKAVKKIGFAKDTGTMVEFEPDPEIFKEISFDLDRIINHFRQQAYLTKGVRISVKDERVPLKYFSKKQNKEITEFPSRSFYFEGGIVSYIEFLNRGLEPKNKNIFYVGKEQQEIFVEVALQYIDELHSQEMSFANNIHTHEGGMHVTGFRSAITRALNDYARKNGILKEKDDNLSGEDIREGLTTVISVKLKEPQFEGQTKAKLGTPDARTAVETVMGTEFVDWLERSPSDAREILEKVILASKARLAAKAARETVLRKGAMEGLTLPGKLADCSSRDATESELFLVEGDSAGGCLDGDTEVALVDGRDVSFRQLVEEDNQGKKNFCYTIDKNGNISVASILNPRITRKNVEVIKIILDNNEEIICTPDHKFMLRDGSYKEAKDLTPADSLMPLYRKYSKIGGRITIEGYEMVLDPKKHFWIFTHLLSDQYNLNHSIYSESDGPQRHHKDFNKLNNSPNNFVRLSREQHFKIHQEIADKILRSPEVLEKLRKIRQTPEFKNKVRKSMLKIRGLLSERAKKQWQDEEYKKFMVNKFLDFYKNNPEYQEKNNLLLDKAQKEYWGNKNNRKIQSNRVAKFFESHPEKKEWLSNIAKTQWQNPELLSWRSGKTKEQWTPGFRAKRKAAYNKTYLSRALKVLHDIYKESGIVDIEKYQAVRQNTNDKNLIKPETILARFFDNNNPQFVEAVKNFNHRIKRIEKLDYLIDVYDIEIPETHNFALASGVFVHNSSKQGRDRKTQAILPLKGKILNVEKARIDKMLAHQEIRALIIAMGTAIAEEFDLNKLRYHKIIIMTDADVDGSHIRTLLLTLFYRYFPQVIEKGHLYIAQPPLYKIQKSGKISYAYNDNEKEKILAELGKAQSAKRKAQKNDEWEVTPLEGNGNPLANGGESTTDEKISGVSIQRYKGLGEMNPIQLWETTLDPANRVLLQVTIKDAHEADRVFDVLMGSDVLPRKKFIQSHAKSVQNLDI